MNEVLPDNLAGFIARERRAIETALCDNLPLSSLPGAHQLNKALAYAIFPGGKRLRPALALLAARLAGTPRAQSLTVACAIEFLHGSSLVLDDLPAMDDASLRRNRRALHLVYGEGVALLAAIALLNRAYELLACVARAGNDARAGGDLLRAAASCIGADGMVGGQAIDLALRADGANADALATRDLKTVALMRLMMTAGALARGADATEVCVLAEFGECFGRAYQICDDLLDEFAASDITGKPERQDARHARASSVGALGIEGAQTFAAQLVERGGARLTRYYGERPEALLLIEAAHALPRRARLVEPAVA